jgi:UDP-N-acetylglucosamine 2-epimerase (non-hydrolysing)
LIGDAFDQIPSMINKLTEGDWKSGDIPALWDGKTSERIVEKIIQIYK